MHFKYFELNKLIKSCSHITLNSISYSIYTIYLLIWFNRFKKKHNAYANLWIFKEEWATLKPFSTNVLCVKDLIVFVNPFWNS